ncbi:hypothetical protein [Planktothrix paucivesiculata]|uniref:Uncharacterized protein n=1 Tax=Planktothrix paucivesiculata PCC 9631 TaxID=671071 RepID=A0A7Z9BG87_9CYAN|nr:hypothetical protein [Planktothrix paucivesiculata]VXD12656.1 conserved hypothetical protein [Planktothrix paucivesiculata PCC 9631]
MTCIRVRDVVQEVMSTGYLSLNLENKLRRMLQTTHYDSEDIHAFANLQLAAMSGKVKQESRELYQLAVMESE